MLMSDKTNVTTDAKSRGLQESKKVEQEGPTVSSVHAPGSGAQTSLKQELTGLSGEAVGL